VTTIVPLKENGQNISVTQENKQEYIQLNAEYRLVSSIKEQIDAFLGGFYEIIPKTLISIASGMV
jgi:E3 ubiquitin-protein ligase HUWE1